MDLRRINALVSGNDGANSGSTLGIDGLAAGDVEGDGHLFDVLLGIVKRTIATKGIGEGVYQLLLAFNTFEPGLCWDTSSTRLADGGYEKWFISFRVRDEKLGAIIVADCLFRIPHTEAFVFSLALVWVMSIFMPSRRG